MKFKSSGFNTVESDSMSDAALVFANRAARRKYGRSGYARTCVQQAHSQDGTLAEYSAFIGYSTGPTETTGNNIHFTVVIG